MKYSKQKQDRCLQSGRVSLLQSRQSSEGTNGFGNAFPSSRALLVVILTIFWRDVIYASFMRLFFFLFFSFFLMSCNLLARSLGAGAKWRRPFSCEMKLGCQTRPLHESLGTPIPPWTFLQTDDRRGTSNYLRDAARRSSSPERDAPPHLLDIQIRSVQTNHSSQLLPWQQR